MLPLICLPKPYPNLFWPLAASSFWCIEWKTSYKLLWTQWLMGLSHQIQSQFSDQHRNVPRHLMGTEELMPKRMFNLWTINTFKQIYFFKKYLEGLELWVFGPDFCFLCWLLMFSWRSTAQCISSKLIFYTVERRWKTFIIDDFHNNHLHTAMTGSDICSPLLFLGSWIVI